MQDSNYEERDLSPSALPASFLLLQLQTGQEVISDSTPGPADLGKGQAGLGRREPEGWREEALTSSSHSPGFGRCLPRTDILW